MDLMHRDLIIYELRQRITKDPLSAVAISIVTLGVLATGLRFLLGS